MAFKKITFPIPFRWWHGALAIAIGVILFAISRIIVIDNYKELKNDGAWARGTVTDVWRLKKTTYKTEYYVNGKTYEGDWIHTDMDCKLNNWCVNKRFWVRYLPADPEIAILFIQFPVTDSLKPPPAMPEENPEVLH